MDETIQDTSIDNQPKADDIVVLEEKPDKVAVPGGFKEGFDPRRCIDGHKKRPFWKIMTEKVAKRYKISFEAAEEIIAEEGVDAIIKSHDMSVLKEYWQQRDGKAPQTLHADVDFKGRQIPKDLTILGGDTQNDTTDNSTQKDTGSQETSAEDNPGGKLGGENDSNPSDTDRPSAERTGETIIGSLPDNAPPETGSGEGLPANS